MSSCEKWAVQLLVIEVSLLQRFHPWNAQSGKHGPMDQQWVRLCDLQPPDQSRCSAACHAQHIRLELKYIFRDIMIQDLLPFSESSHAFFQVAFCLILGVHSRCDRDGRKCLADYDPKMVRELAKGVITTLKWFKSKRGARKLSVCCAAKAALCGEPPTCGEVGQLIP